MFDFEEKKLVTYVRANLEDINYYLKEVDAVIDKEFNKDEFTLYRHYGKPNQDIVIFDGKEKGKWSIDIVLWKLAKGMLGFVANEEE